ncbi:MAG: hypothetical protein JW834_04835 [Candidatus Diapherotrites archaeon]|nr:hypothetical protein [Candidatus Diapherotrites archaeon]
MEKKPPSPKTYWTKKYVDFWTDKRLDLMKKSLASGRGLPRFQPPNEGMKEAINRAVEQLLSDKKFNARKYLTPTQYAVLNATRSAGEASLGSILESLENRGIEKHAALEEIEELMRSKYIEGRIQKPDTDPTP